jgi:biopolymer transport protein ExbB/TolQ
MFKLFYQGGPLFMGILTLLLTAIVAIAVYYYVLISRKDYKDISETRQKLKYLKSLGTFSLVVGFLGQMIGLYDAFEIIEQVTEISPSLLAGGLKVSMITSLYGILIFLVSYLLWFIADNYASRQEVK